MDRNYDAFVSYSGYDRDWVHNWLLPHLVGNRLRVCIDSRDFDVGVTISDNIEHAVARSRKTILVLTPHWIESEWANFESLLLQSDDPTGVRRKLLPIMLEECKPPKRLSIFNYADFRRQDMWEDELRRLIEAFSEVGSDLRLAEDFGEIRSPETNPYRAGSMISDRKFFFGRAVELRETYEWLKTMQSVSVIGESRIGRSSFLFHICQSTHDKLGADYECFYLDFQRILSDQEFFARVCKLLGGKGTECVNGFETTRYRIY